jgi:deazaflavin-dependent oxidoreductase (nitroreductase family)
VNSDEVKALLDSVETVDITTIGRNSGIPRRIEIWTYAVNGRNVITGTPGPRDWYANLLANPSLTVHLPGGVDLPAVATPVLDEDVRRQVFTADKTWWYRSQVDLEELIARSPMVELRF